MVGAVEDDLDSGEPRGFQFQRGRGAGLTSARHGGVDSQNGRIESNPESLAAAAIRSKAPCLAAAAVPVGSSDRLPRTSLVRPRRRWSKIAHDRCSIKTGRWSLEGLERLIPPLNLSAPDPMSLLVCNSDATGSYRVDRPFRSGDHGQQVGLNGCASSVRYFLYAFYMSDSFGPSTVHGRGSN